MAIEQASPVRAAPVQASPVKASPVKELPWSAAGHAAPDAAAHSATAKPARKLPVQRDWPAWIIICVQLGILVGIVGLWEIGATAGFVDAFFWSQPSAIYKTLQIFFSTRAPR